MADEMADESRIIGIIDDILTEYGNATAQFGPFASAHEGYAIMLEEMDELWDEIKSKKGTAQSAYKEAKQVAAMALRFMVDLPPE